MKRVFLVIVSAVVMLCSCGKAPVSGNGEVLKVADRTCICNTGELYLDSSQRLNFIDFTTMQSTLICSKPNCNHQSPDECSSYGMSNGAFIYGSNIYYFDREVTMNGNKANYVTKLMKANVDGTGRTVVLEIKDRTSPDYDRRFVVGSTLYFGTQETNYDEDGKETSLAGLYLCSYDLDSGEYREILKTIEGRNANMYAFGVHDGGIYYTTSYVEEDIPWQSFLDPDFVPDYINDYYRYDIESGEAEKIDSYIFSTGDGSYVEVSGDVTMLVSEGGKRTDISDIRSVYTLVNGKLFDPTDKVVIDSASSERHEMKTDAEVIYYLDGEYVVRDFQQDENGFITGYRYERLTEDNLIGEVK